MPSYLVESCLAGAQRTVDDARARTRLTAELGSDVRYLRTTFLPEDEVVFHLFEAPSIEALEGAGRRADLPFERIVEAVEGVEESGEETRR